MAGVSVLPAIPASPQRKNAVCHDRCTSASIQWHFAEDSGCFVSFGCGAPGVVFWRPSICLEHVFLGKRETPVDVRGLECGPSKCLGRNQQRHGCRRHSRYLIGELVLCATLSLRAPITNKCGSWFRQHSRSMCGGRSALQLRFPAFHNSQPFARKWLTGHLAPFLCAANSRTIMALACTVGQKVPKESYDGKPLSRLASMVPAFKPTKDEVKDELLKQQRANLIRIIDHLVKNAGARLGGEQLDVVQ